LLRDAVALMVASTVVKLPPRYTEPATPGVTAIALTVLSGFGFQVLSTAPLGRTCTARLIEPSPFTAVNEPTA
jgi:hypothetical protein